MTFLAYTIGSCYPRVGVNRNGFSGSMFDESTLEAPDLKVAQTFLKMRSATGRISKLYSLLLLVVATLN